MISDGQWDSVFGLGFGRLQGGFSADVVDTFQSISDDRVWIVAFGKKIAHFVGFGREIHTFPLRSVSSLIPFLTPFTHNPLIRSDEGLALETSAIVSFTAFHYPHQHTVDTPVCLPPRRRSQPGSLKSWHYTFQVCFYKHVFKRFSFCIRDCSLLIKMWCDRSA